MARGGDISNGNVFTIDCCGNTRISGDLIVDGSQVIFRTEILDVSDSNLSLNYPGNSVPEGGGITLLSNSGATQRINLEECWWTWRQHKLLGYLLVQIFQRMIFMLVNISGHHAISSQDDAKL